MSFSFKQLLQYIIYTDNLKKEYLEIILEQSKKIKKTLEVSDEDLKIIYKELQKYKNETFQCFVVGPFHIFLYNINKNIELIPLYFGWNVTGLSHSNSEEDKNQYVAESICLIKSFVVGNYKLKFSILKETAFDYLKKNNNKITYEFQEGREYYSIDDDNFFS